MFVTSISKDFCTGYTVFVNLNKLLSSYIPVKPFLINMAEIPPSQMPMDVHSRLVNSPRNPNDCPCGWYIYYSSVCMHVYQEVKYECGNKDRGFCKSPAPKNIVQGVQINAQCPYC